jgi:hypothetical protein
LAAKKAGGGRAAQEKELGSSRSPASNTSQAADELEFRGATINPQGNPPPFRVLFLELDLYLEALVGTTATSLLELPGGRAGPGHVRLDVAVSVDVLHTGAVAEVLVGLTGVLLATEEYDIGCLGVPKYELIKGDAFTASVGDSSPSTRCELKRADSELAEVLSHAYIISDGGYNYGSLALLALHEASQSGDRERGTVGTGLEKTLEDLFILLGIGTARKEAIEL